jgi:hypothetical protein
MLISVCGTGGDADGRDVIWGNFGYHNPIIQITSKNIPGFGTESQNKISMPLGIHIFIFYLIILQNKYPLVSCNPSFDDAVRNCKNKNIVLIFL